jgi:ribonuclease R
LVHISSLGQDYFHFDPLSHQLKGEHSNTRYRLGDTVKVKVARVDLDEKKMDFALVGVTPKSKTNAEASFKQAESKPKPKRKSVKKPAAKQPEPEKAKIDADSVVAPAKKKRRRRNKTAKKPVSIES